MTRWWADGGVSATAPQAEGAIGPDGAGVLVSMPGALGDTCPSCGTENGDLSRSNCCYTGGSWDGQCSSPEHYANGYKLCHGLTAAWTESALACTDIDPPSDWLNNNCALQLKNDKCDERRE